MSAYIPIVVENEGRIERNYDLWSRLLKDRIIMVSGEIEPHMASIICGEILYLASEDKKNPIRMYIYSPGGHVTAGLMITGTMRTCGCDIETFSTGLVASMGSFIAAAGTKGMRKSLKECTWMIHEVSSGTSGKTTDMEISLNETKRLNNMLANKLAEFTGQPLKKIMKDISRDKYMTAEEAKEYGLCDIIM